MRALLVGTSLLLLAVSSAKAADPMVVPADPVDPARFGWTGIYLGGAAGYGWLQDVDESFTPPLEDEGEDWVIGGHVGYLQQFGNFVAGAEVEATRLDINYEFLNFISIDNAILPKARLGYAFDRFLVSGNIGAVYLTTNVGLKDWGLAAGAGVDYALTDNVTMGAQYTRYKFDDFDGTLIDGSIDLVTGRFGYKF